MRPISVEFQAFGPYKGTETINFDLLSQNGPFLICGETGSGKTMILDAITFALYGKSSGANRDDLFQLRCNRCEPSADTYVKFMFEEKGDIYLFERKLVFKRTKLSKSQNAYRLENGVLVPLFENCHEKELNNKAEELIGLSYEQFRQVIILPQGKFEKLLTSESSEKEAILVSIFGAEKWQGIADKYYERAKARKDELDEIKKTRERSLQEEGLASLNDLKSKIDQLKESIDVRDAEYKNAGYPARKKALDAQKVLANDFATLHGYQASADALEGKAEQNCKDEEKLAVSKRAELIRGPVDRKNKAQNDLKKREQSLTKAEKALSSAAEKDSDAKEAMAKHAEKEAEYKKWIALKVELESKRTVYESYDGLADGEKKAKAELDESEKAEKRLKGLLDKARADLNSAYEAYQAARIETTRLNASYMKGVAGILANSLVDGAECPVCGSIHHPKKAEMEEGTASEKDIKAAAEIEEEKKKIWEEADRKRKAADEKYDARVKESSQFRTAYETAKTRRESAAEALEAGISTLSELLEKIKDLSRKIDCYEKDGKKLQEALTAAQNEFSGAKSAKKSAEDEVAKAKDALLVTEKEIFAALASSGFASEEEAAGYMMEDGERSELEQQISGYKAKLSQMRDLLSKKKSALEGLIEPDLEKVDSELKGISDAEKRFHELQSKDSAEKARLEKKYNNLEKDCRKYEGQIQAAEDDLIFAKSLRGDTGIGLQRYVLGIMFSSVIGAANEMLTKVHGGRYRLFRTNEKTGSGNKRGLDLKVYDSFGGGAEGRSVSTLSGGEKFLASLALSIGMSTIAKTGGVDIEGLFIDEGFGSLDNDSIGDALSILTGIQKSKGMVGIISHVDVLKGNLQTQLNVVKGRGTSSIKIS